MFQVGVDEYMSFQLFEIDESDCEKVTQGTKRKRTTKSKKQITENTAKKGTFKYKI